MLPLQSEPCRRPLVWVHLPDDTPVCFFQLLIRAVPVEPGLETKLLTKVQQQGDERTFGFLKRPGLHG